jgi:L-alanine-DL-glutamate epimerase-like enolase superfamily enzyme
VPLHRLLGASKRSRIPAYASLLRIGTPESIASECQTALRRGYTAIKLHETTTPAVFAARQAAGARVPLMVDMNCPSDGAEAIAFAQACRAATPMFIEEPVWPPEDHTGLARVQAQGGIPTAAGENSMLAEFKSMFEAGAITYAQPSITKVGGVTQLRKVMALADAFGVSVMPHSAYFGPGLIASIHCIAAMPNESLVERYDCDFAVNPMHDAINPSRDGCIAVPQGPGLGIDPDPVVIEKLRVG